MAFTLRHALLAAATLSLAGLAAAQTAITGFDVNHPCASPSDAVDNPTAGAELYAVKLTSAATVNDWECDTTNKGGASIGAAQLQSPGWIVGPNWTNTEDPTQNVYVYITFPNGKVYVASGQIGTTGGDFGAGMVQTVGNAVPTGELASNGLTLSGTGAQYSVDLGVGSKMFPFGAAMAVESAFVPVVDVSTTTFGALGCTWGGQVPSSHASGTAAGQGLIQGYNVYRMAGTAATVPTAAQLGTIANWAYYIDLRTVNMTGTDTAGSGPPGNGADAPTDSAADTDLAGLDNNDGVAYTSDEVVLFSDQNSNPNGTARAGGVAGPATGQGYWYAFQPVVEGSVADFTSSQIAGGAAADHRLDLDTDGTKESVDIDGVAASAEFISPQVQHGITTGLGLTNAGVPLLTAPVFGQINPAAAHGDVQLTAIPAGNDVNITFTTAIEGANVLGFNVYRVEGDTRAKVNEQLIAARGGEGSVYSVVDKAIGTSRRVRRASTLQYSVDVLYNDGTPTRTVGPFAVAVGETSRRSR